MIAICCLVVDQWQSKTLFLNILDACLSIVKNVFDCCLSGVILEFGIYHTDNQRLHHQSLCQDEGCSNMNASSFITFFTYMIRQNGKLFNKGLYVTFKLAPDLKKNTMYLLSYSPLNEGHVSILTNAALRTYNSDRDERVILQ